jgi:hypothetical protein
MLLALLLGGQHLDGGVGIGQRGGLGRGHDQHFGGQRHGEQHHVGDAGAGVEQHHVVAGRQCVDHMHQLVADFRGQAGIFHHARAGQQHREAAGRGDHRFFQRGLAGEHIVQRDLGVEVQHHVQIGQAQVGIQHQHAQAMAGEGCSQVGGDKGFPDAALAAGDGNDVRANHAKKVHAWTGQWLTGKGGQHVAHLIAFS